MMVPDVHDAGQGGDGCRNSLTLPRERVSDDYHFLHGLPGQLFQGEKIEVIGVQVEKIASTGWISRFPRRGSGNSRRASA